jgi:hypothetical protein
VRDIYNLHFTNINEYNAKTVLLAKKHFKILY